MNGYFKKLITSESFLLELWRWGQNLRNLTCSMQHNPLKDCAIFLARDPLVGRFILIKIWHNPPVDQIPLNMSIKIEETFIINKFD